MKRILSLVAYLLAFCAVAVAGAMLYVKFALPNVGEAEAITIDYTPERVARGEYLATAVAVCMDCHSTRDWTKFSAPLIQSTLGQGGERFDQKMGLPGKFLSRNITPHGIGRYTDGELFRVITTGVTKEGRAMFPLMPYAYYGRMDREDIYSIIAYVRSIPSIVNEVEPSQADFPMNFIINTIPQPANFQKRPDRSNLLAYGAYMINATACAECHTPVDKGRIIADQKFSGGREFRFANGAVVRSSNLTPDPETGIGKWTEEDFVRKFKHYADSANINAVQPGEFNSFMPWTMYAKMETEDLAAIFAYLKSVKPITNSVTRFTPAP